MIPRPEATLKPLYVLLLLLLFVHVMDEPSLMNPIGMIFIFLAGGMFLYPLYGRTYRWWVWLVAPLVGAGTGWLRERGPSPVPNAVVENRGGVATILFVAGLIYVGYRHIYPMFRSRRRVDVYQQ